MERDFYQGERENSLHSTTDVWISRPDGDIMRSINTATHYIVGHGGLSSITHLYKEIFHMKEFAILSDSCLDLPGELVAQLEIGVAPLSVAYDENTIFDDGTMDPHDFYEGIRGGKMPQTSAVNLEGWSRRMEPALKQGKDVLVLCISSALSTTYQSAVIAAGELMEKYPERKIRVADTLSASVGLGLLVWNAARLRAEGKDLDTVYAWVEENKLHVCHWVTVNDLMHLKRGGRVSAATAVVGTMLQIKPVLIVDNGGRLETAAKARGRKAAMQMLVDKLVKTGIPGANDMVFLGHGDCPEEAETMAQLLKDAGVKHVIVNHVGNVVGSHTGPDVLVIAFLGAQR